MTALDSSNDHSNRNSAEKGHADGRADMAGLRARVAELHRRKELARRGPNDRATEQQRRRGKMLVRERIEVLLDADSFVEVGEHRTHHATLFGMDARRPDTDGVVTGWGTIDGRKVFVYAHDFRILGGSLGAAHAAKIHTIMDMAEATGAPLISLNDGAGARIQEGVTALAGYGGIFARNVRASGVIPQISVMLGPCAGGAAYSPALTDFVFVVRDIAQMFVTGPEVVESVTGESVDHDQLGGADVHSTRSGVATFVHNDEIECLEEVRHLVSLLPSNNQEMPPDIATDDPPTRSTESLLDLVPVESNQSYDVHAVLAEVVDDGDYLEFHEHWARNIICALGVIDGQVVGVVANQPAVLAGVLDIEASEKAARFVQTCDAFNVPLVTLVDVPGFLPGTDQEHNGIIRHGAKLLHAYCSATVPRIQVILRKAYGGAYIVMDSRSIGADLSLSWPCNEVAVMGAEGAANVIFRKRIAEASDSERESVRAECTEMYRGELMHPYYAAEHGLVDEVIDPADTRSMLASSLTMLRSKLAPQAYRKHSNPPM